MVASCNSSKPNPTEAELLWNAVQSSVTIQKYLLAAFHSMFQVQTQWTGQNHQSNSKLDIVHMWPEKFYQSVSSEGTFGCGRGGEEGKIWRVGQQIDE